MITKETAIELAKEAHGPITSQWMDMDYAALHRLCNLAIAHAQKDAEPFGYFQYSIQLDAWVQNRGSNKGAAFYTHPAHDDTALLRQALEALVSSTFQSAAITALRERLGEKV